MIATLATQAAERGYDVGIVSGDRDAFQLVSERVTVLYPTQGRDRSGPDRSRSCRRSVRRRTGAVPRPRRPASGSPATTCPGVPGVGPKTAAKWLTEYGSLGALVDAVDTVKGKAGDSLREHLAQVMLNRRVNELVRDLSAGRRAATTWACAHGTATTCTRSSTRCSSGCCATGSSRRCRPRSPRPSTGSHVDARPSGGRQRRRVARRPRPGSRSHRAGLLGHLGSGHRGGDGLALAASDGAAAWIDPVDDRPGRRGGACRVARRPRSRQGAARRQGPVARAGGTRLGPRRRHQRHPAVRLPRPARPAQLRPRRPRAALPPPRAARRGRRGRAAELRRSRRGGRAVQRSRCGHARWSTSPRCSTSSSPSAARRGCSPRWSSPWCRCSRRWSRRASPSTSTTSRHCTTGSRRGCRTAAEVGVRGHRHASSTSARRSSCRWSSSTSWACPRPSASRRATRPTPTRCSGLYAQTGHPLLEHLLRIATSPGCSSPSRGCRSRSRTTAGSTRLQPDRRGHRPALLDRPQPAEHPDPHRGGPHHPGGVRRRRGLRVADDRRLQPDRDADHGAPVR